MKCNEKVIEIQFNKKMQFILLFARSVFVILITILWIWLGTLYNSRRSRIFNEIFNWPGIGSIIAWSFITIPLLVYLFSIKRSLEDLPALTITNEGILYYSGFFVSKHYFVGWGDIMEIKETNIQNQRLLHLITKDSQKYIDEEKGVFEKIFMRINLKTYGSIISISSNNLKCSHEELKFIFKPKV